MINYAAGGIVYVGQIIVSYKIFELEKAHGMTVVLLLPLMCVWFANELETYGNIPDKRRPLRWLLYISGWVFLFTPTIAWLLGATP